MIAEQNAAYSEQGILPNAEKVGIYLGIDFGTSYTKVCYRIRGRGINQVKVLPLEPTAQTPGIIPSVVYEATYGKLYTALSKNIPPVSITHKYLKMRLASTWLADPCMTSNKDICLSAFYISEVLKASRKYILKAESTMLVGKRVLWFAKLCVPIGENNHSLLDSFGSFYDRCWQLADRSYDNSLSEIAAILQSIDPDPNNSHCQAYPEIGAAVHSFLLTREAVPGLYCYIDIGGGTLDCSSFHLKRDMNGYSSIYVYSTKVSRLGMEWISEHIGISPEELSRLDVAVPNVSSIGVQKKLRVSRRGYSNK